MKTTVDTSQFKQLARDFMKAAPAVEASVVKSLLASAEAVRKDAIARVNSWARADSGPSGRKQGRPGGRVAASIRVRMLGATTAVVEAGGPQAPEAVPIENRGRGYVRHPVFGHRDRMTSKNSHPAFQGPARDHGRPIAEAAIEKAGVDAVKRELHAR